MPKQFSHSVNMNCNNKCTMLVTARYTLSIGPKSLLLVWQVSHGEKLQHDIVSRRRTRAVMKMAIYMAVQYERLPNGFIFRVIYKPNHAEIAHLYLGFQQCMYTLVLNYYLRAVSNLATMHILKTVWCCSLYLWDLQIQARNILSNGSAFWARETLCTCLLQCM